MTGESRRGQRSLARSMAALDLPGAGSRGLIGRKRLRAPATRRSDAGGARTTAVTHVTWPRAAGSFAKAAPPSNLDAWHAREEARAAGKVGDAEVGAFMLARLSAMPGFRREWCSGKPASLVKALCTSAPVVLGDDGAPVPTPWMGRPFRCRGRRRRNPPHQPQQLQQSPPPPPPPPPAAP